MWFIGEIIQTAVLDHKKTKVFSHMDQINLSIRVSLYSHSQIPKPSLSSELNIFVSSLNAAVRMEFFSNASALSY